MKKWIAYMLSFCMLLTGMSTLAHAANTEMQADEHTVPLFACDKPLGQFTVDEKDYKAGGSSLTYMLGTYTNEEGKMVTNDGQSSFSFQVKDTVGKESVDASKMDTLEFWFYVSDLEALKAVTFRDNAIELTSAGTCDKEETNWRLNDILSQCDGNGWHEIRLHFSKEINNATDWTRLNYLRWYFVNGANFPSRPITLKIDNIRLTDYQAQQVVKQTPVAEAMSKKIQEQLSDIPEWDETDPAIVAAYEENALQWYQTYEQIKSEHDAMDEYARQLVTEMGAKVILNRVNRHLNRYEQYIGQTLDQLLPNPDEIVEDGESKVNTPLIVTIFSLCVVAMLLDVWVYMLIKKKDRRADA